MIHKLKCADFMKAKLKTRAGAHKATIKNAQKMFYE